MFFILDPIENFETVTTFCFIWQIIACKNRNKDKDIPRSIR